MVIAMGVCGIVTVGALVLSGIALNKASQAEATAGGSTTITAAPQNAQLFEDAADLSLCKALPNLMRERNADDRAFQALPPAGSLSATPLSLPISRGWKIGRNACKQSSMSIRLRVGT